LSPYPFSMTAMSNSGFAARIHLRHAAIKVAANGSGHFGGTMQ
jgi:hypothetical protein